MAGYRWRAVGQAPPAEIIAPDQVTVRFANRDDLVLIREADIPPWPCCGGHGPHSRDCPWAPEAQD